MSKKVMDNIKVAVIIVICSIAAVGMAVIDDYNIIDSKDDIERAISRFIKIEDTEIKKTVEIENVKMVLFLGSEYHGDRRTIGESELIKGINNKYKIDYAGLTGVNPYTPGIRTIKGKEYFVIKGKNPGAIISYIQVGIQGEKYKIELSKEEWYMEVVPLGEAKNRGRFPESLDLYNADNEKIDVGTIIEGECDF